MSKQHQKLLDQIDAYKEVTKNMATLLTKLVQERRFLPNEETPVIETIAILNQLNSNRIPAQHPMNRDYVDEAAKAVEAKLPDMWQFMLMMVPPTGIGDGRLRYVSSMERATAVAILKEWLIKCSGEEDWMKHLD